MFVAVMKTGLKNITSSIDDDIVLIMRSGLCYSLLSILFFRPFYIYYTSLKCRFMYSKNYIKINNYITLLMNPQELIEQEICEECNGKINCKKDNIYILIKDEKEKLWCQCCFEELWKEYSNNGWTGDDIEYYLELEKEEKETS